MSGDPQAPAGALPADPRKHRTLILTLAVRVTDLSAEHRKACEEGTPWDDEPLPTLADMASPAGAQEVGRAIASGMSMDGVAQEMLTGSDIYVRFTSAKLCTCDWEADSDR